MPRWLESQEPTTLNRLASRTSIADGFTALCSW